MTSSTDQADRTRVTALAPRTAPLIGITGPRLPAADLAGTPAILRHAWVDAHWTFYAAAVAGAGGLPVHVPREADPDGIVQRLDGLVIAGGQDVDPRSYGAQPTWRSTLIDPGRDRFERLLIDAALDTDTPLVGVCRGAHLLNVALGGTLLADLAASQAVEHTLVLYPPETRVHEVRMTPGSTCHGLYGDSQWVNSFHHQGVDALGSGVRATGVAADGVVEAIEVDGARAIGVQWHPEMLGELDPLFRWLAGEGPTPQRSAPAQLRSRRSTS